MKWYVSYFSRGVYTFKIVTADNAQQAIKRSRVNNINDLKIITDDEQTARENPGSYTFLELDYNDSMIKGKVPVFIRDEVCNYMELRRVGLHDAFHYSLRDNYNKLSKALKQAYMTSEYKKYIPSAYIGG